MLYQTCLLAGVMGLLLFAISICAQRQNSFLCAATDSAPCSVLIAMGRTIMNSNKAAEQRLWSALKGRQLAGFKFARHHPIGPYVADFVCCDRALVIEVDGKTPLQRARDDRKRDEFLVRSGYAVFRVPADDVMRNKVAVCESLRAVLEDRIEDFVGG
jgi:very-short-patch-repair endonuclease